MYDLYAGYIQRLLNILTHLLSKLALPRCRCLVCAREPKVQGGGIIATVGFLVQAKLAQK